MAFWVTVEDHIGASSRGVTIKVSAGLTKAVASSLTAIHVIQLHYLAHQEYIFGPETQ